MSKFARRKNRVQKDRQKNNRRAYLQECLNQISNFVWFHIVNDEPLPKMLLKIEFIEKQQELQQIIQEKVGEAA